VPLLLLVFFVVQSTVLLLSVAGTVALMLYSLTHVGEILRSYVAAYPRAETEQGRVLGMGPVRRELRLRGPWTLLRSFEAIGTHAVSLLKDTGALTIVGIGELTTIARSMGTDASFRRWAFVLGTAAALYLATTLLLVFGISVFSRSMNLRRTKTL
jgi:ABC-type amino acid transport system permease subunit